MEEVGRILRCMIESSGLNIKSDSVVSSEESEKHSREKILSS